MISGGGVASLLLAAGLLCGATWIARSLGIQVHPLALLGALPVLIVAGVAILLPIAFFVSARRRRRSLERERLGLCSRCGYDLRGTRHDLCPECGLLVIRRRDPVTGKELD
jgi:hypothetical protein